MAKKKEFVFYWDKPSDFTNKKETKNSEYTLDAGKSIPVNIEETEKDILLKASIVNFKKNEINLNVTNSTIEISASKQQEKFGKYNHKQEKFCSSIRETFSLPDKIDPDTAVAKLEKGMLTVKMEKTSEKKKRKKLDIN
jgi:HSP20 family protein